ncbi:MAG: hypothetical protein ABFS28_13500 [Bacteroidota bacterium]
MKKLRIHIVTFVISVTLVTFSACEINQKEIMPEDGFTKIYNHPEEELSYYPESVVELSGGGFLFLSAVKDENAEIEYPGTSLVRTSASGEVEWTMSYDWLAPSSRLIQQGGLLGFVAMNQQFEAHVVLVDPANGNISGQHDLEMTMPLYAYADSRGDLVVLGYDFVSRSSWISRYNADFTLQRSTMLPINTDLEYLIQRHLNKTGQDFHFFIGEYSNEAGTGYYVNCFYNYTLRSVFLDISSLNATGDIYSFQIEEGISSLIQNSGSLFGLSSYYEGNNYILSEAELDISASQNIRDLPAKPLYELTYKARVVAEKMTADGKEYTLFTSQTNTNSLVLYQYLTKADSLINTHQHNFDQRVIVSDVIQTADQGVTILGGIYILGKYQRPLLIKMPVDPFILED